MATTGNSTPRKRGTGVAHSPLVPLAAWIAVAWSAPAGAAEWKIAPGVDIKETYTDNVTLAPSGTARSDFITEISPRISIRGTGARLKLSADYAMQNFLYARDSGASDTHHSLQAAINAELLEDLFYIDGKASAGQQAVSAFGPQVTGSGHRTGNQADVRTYSVSPYLRRHFGRRATAEIRYSREVVGATAGSLVDSQSDRIRIALGSGPGFRTLRWDVSYDEQRIDYDTAPDVDTKALSGSLRYRISSRIALTAAAGHEDNNYVALGEKPEGNYWSAGLHWTPTVRTNIAASAGRRFFGNTLAFSLQHRTRMTVWSAGYQEDVTTTRSQFLVPSVRDTAAFLDELWINSIPEQATREAVVQQFMQDAGLPASLIVPVNSFTNHVFLQKSAHASIAFKGARNIVTTSIYRMQREPQSAPDADRAAVPAAPDLLGETTRQDGISTVWQSRLSPRTSMTASAGFGRVRSASSGRRDDNVTVRLGLTRQLQQKLRGGVELRHQEKRSSQPGADFRENAVAAFLQISF